MFKLNFQINVLQRILLLLGAAGLFFIAMDLRDAFKLIGVIVAIVFMFIGLKTNKKDE